jgi:hypothetical protein
MTQEEIIEGNKLIAEFMGKKTTKIEYEKNESVVCPVPLYYDSSWDWLIPVVEKIELGARVDIYGKACKISQSQWTVDIAHINEKKIIAVWECVVDFIQWYNKQVK